MRHPASLGSSMCHHQRTLLCIWKQCVKISNDPDIKYSKYATATKRKRLVSIPIQKGWGQEQRAPPTIPMCLYNKPSHFTTFFSNCYNQYNLQIQYFITSRHPIVYILDHSFTETTLSYNFVFEPSVFPWTWPWIGEGEFYNSINL